MSWVTFCRFLGLAGIMLFLITAFTPLPNLLGRSWGTPPRVERADAIVVLAAGLRGDGTLTDGSLRRAVHGIALHRKGLAPLLVFTGPSRASGRFEAEVRAELARDMGIPPEAILVEPGGPTTRDEAVRVGTRLRAKGLRTVLLVTDSQHLTRSRGLFERGGFDVIPASVDDMPGRDEGPEQRLRLMRWVLKERIARLYYQATGYLEH